MKEGFDLEAGRDLRIAGRFQQPQGWPSSAKEGVWMFDNEIDWVTQIGLPSVRREARRVAQDSEERIHTRPSTSYELLHVE